MEITRQDNIVLGNGDDTKPKNEGQQETSGIETNLIRHDGVAEGNNDNILRDADDHIVDYPNSEDGDDQGDQFGEFENEDHGESDSASDSNSDSNSDSDSAAMNPTQEWDSDEEDEPMDIDDDLFAVDLDLGNGNDLELLHDNENNRPSDAWRAPATTYDFHPDVEYTMTFDDMPDLTHHAYYAQHHANTDHTLSDLIYNDDELLWKD